LKILVQVMIMVGWSIFLYYLLELTYNIPGTGFRCSTSQNRYTT